MDLACQNDKWPRSITAPPVCECKQESKKGNIKNSREIIARERLKSHRRDSLIGIMQVTFDNNSWEPQKQSSAIRVETLAGKSAESYEMQDFSLKYRPERSWKGFTSSVIAMVVAHGRSKAQGL